MVYLVGNDWGGRNITTVFQETKKKQVSVGMAVHVP